MISSYEPYEVAKLWAELNNIGTRNTWRNTSRPVSLPASPWLFYPDYEERGGDAAFFKSKKRATYEEARAFAKKNQIIGLNDWISRIHDGRTPSFYPTQPSMYYKEYTEKGGTKNFFYQRPTHTPYSVAQRWAREHNIVTTYQWVNAKKPPSFPSNPAKYYPDYEKRGGHDAFFGVSYKQNYSHLSYEDVKKVAHQNKIKNKAQWFKFWSDNGKKLGIPRFPNLLFKEEFNPMDFYFSEDNNKPVFNLSEKENNVV